MNKMKSFDKLLTPHRTGKINYQTKTDYSEITTITQTQLYKQQLPHKNWTDLANNKRNDSKISGTTN